MFPTGTPLNQQNIGATIRQPSTANLLVASPDRSTFNISGAVSGDNPADFTIYKGQNILAGFFTRIAPTEVVLDWCVDNIAQYWSNNLFYVDISGTQRSYVVPQGQYTTAQALDQIVTGLNAQSGVSGQYVFSLTTLSGSGIKSLSLNTSGGAAQTFTVKTVANSGLNVGLLPTQLNIKTNVSGTSFPIDCPKLLPTQYIDFVCPQLTYNQALKDTTTSQYEQNIIYRWYFAWETPEPVDAYGYPIYQGQKRFVQRRPIAFPKQIAWTPNQPIGNLTFQVYDDSNTILNPALVSGEMEWYMTLLVSEN